MSQDQADAEQLREVWGRAGGPGMLGGGEEELPQGWRGDGGRGD